VRSGGAKSPPCSEPKHSPEARPQGFPGCKAARVLRPSLFQGRKDALGSFELLEQEREGRMADQKAAVLNPTREGDLRE
jgi:hypothetical protein